MINLHTSTSTFDQLHEVADSRKATVRVDREALLGLLLDHTIMLQELQGKGVKTTEPVKHRDRPRLKPILKAAD